MFQKTLPTTYPDFFAKLVPNGPAPYPYQLRVSSALIAGKNIILRAPTGAGKTWATVAPFLFARAQGKPFADRLLYALPLRTLASALCTSVRDSAPTASVALQIGGESGDPFFESDIVFTTIDQLLSSYLLHPVGLSPRLDNINAGALPGALIVLDEFHLLDHDRALGTAIEMLSALNGLTQFVVMTATLSSPAVAWLARSLKAEVITLSPEEHSQLPAQINRSRVWSWSDTPLTADAILAKDSNQRIIALTNTVSGAQRLYQSLKDRICPDRPLLLLHSRFLPSDRRKTEDLLANLFGPSAPLVNNAILVSTQVVEAGIDISAEQLHTEIAPLNALIQRAGRVARYPHRNQGSVYVYPAQSRFPYQLSEPEQLAISRLVASNLPEESWIDTHYQNFEANRLRIHYGNLTARRNQVRAAQDAPDRSCLSELVRETNSINVLISDQPDATPFNAGTWPQTLSISAHSLFFLDKYFSAPPPGVPWVAQKLTIPEEGPMTWEPISNMATARSQWLLLLHPKVAHYSPELGLVLDQEGPSLAFEPAPRAPRLRYSYKLESWADHTHRVMQQAASQAAKYQIAAQRLALFADIESLIQYACAGHDAGKLTNEWQAVAAEWQSRKDPLFVWKEPLAHTSWQPGDPRITFPPHAVTGLLIADSLIHALSSSAYPEPVSLASAVLSAIARHHAPRAANLQSFQINPKSLAELSKAMSFPVVSNYQNLLLTFSYHLLTFQESTTQLSFLYLVLVRRLRLADQTATAAANQ